MRYVMEYGILIAIGEDNSFQIVGSIASIDEANEAAENYLNIGPDAGYVAPYEFQIHRRGISGGYTKIERFGIPALM